MPGITGIISRLPGCNYEMFVSTMVASMKHEPFYAAGTFSAPQLGLFAGWVAHKDSAATNQIFTNEQKDIALLFTGECFIDVGAKDRLKQKGHIFSNKGSDCLVHLYEEQGDSFFENLNGLFSGLLIDRRKNKVFLFNDRYGVERIYWHETSDAFYFASEAKALLRILPALRAFDNEGVAEFIAVGCTLEGRTLFRGVGLLPGGSRWTFENGRHIRETYFSPEKWQQLPILKEEDYKTEFQNIFQRILPLYFESESRIGISLTAGLDTRMIMACRPDLAQKPVCYTFEGETGKTLDTRLAARVAEAAGLEYHILRMGKDFFSNFASHVDQTVYITDGYFGVLGAHEIYLNRLARQVASVRLGGAFGGEVLREVSTFKPARYVAQLIHPDFHGHVEGVGRRLPGGECHPVTFAAFREIPLNIYGSPAICRAQLNFRTPYLDNEIVALAYQSPATFRRTPQLALQVIRDSDPVLGRIPTDMGYVVNGSRLKFISKHVFSRATFKLDYIYNEGLPNRLSPLDSLFKYCGSQLGVLGLHKYLHYRRWFRDELASYVDHAMLDCQREVSQFWNPTYLNHVAEDHIRGRANNVVEINKILTLAAIQRLLFRQQEKEDVLETTAHTA